MRFVYIAASAFAAVVSAQVGGTENPFNVPQGGYEFNAGEPTTLQWDPTTDGTVTIKLQYGDEITPDSGIILAGELAHKSDEMRLMRMMGFCRTNKRHAWTLDG